jgi:hypothetical protein
MQRANGDPMAEIGAMTRCGQVHSGATLRAVREHDVAALGARTLVVVLASAIVAACQPKPQSPPQGPPTLPSPAPGPSKKPTTPPGPQSEARATRTAVAAVEARAMGNFRIGSGVQT